MSRAKWDAYLYPGTAVLVNKASLKEEGKLRAFEQEVTALRLAQLRQNPVPPTFDLAHMKAIHRHVFQDVYEWAGSVRDVNIVKGTGNDKTLFAKTGDIEADATAIHKAIRDGDFLRGLDHKAFAWEMGAIYTTINDLHPFREGNGRVTREFMTQLAENAGYALDYKKVGRTAWNVAATQASHGNSKQIEVVFETISAPVKEVEARHPATSAQRSEISIHACLKDHGYGLVERSGGQDRQYFGPVVARTAMHVAQDIGRGRAVVHDLRALSSAPSIGERLSVHFKGGVGSVLGLMRQGLEMGR